MHAYSASQNLSSQTDRKLNILFRCETHMHRYIRLRNVDRHVMNTFSPFSYPQVMDKHLQDLAKQHVETRFVRVRIPIPSPSTNTLPDDIPHPHSVGSVTEYG